ncbi:hypothetical protein M3210_03675 [Oceanobacillus luteolus]|uniref:hypothetical protein n=1 Tax=Oceanobacillus luteolus TaxID=1274358 RepID=UPI002042090D|nr:hypothetical protein [Oceanobacillus luteolus]MCM3739363.1 hypothetical protein [Oceanobacillus luteolus]
MKHNEKAYAILITILILLAFVVPYTLLRNVNAWYGSFLFWTALTILVIGVNYIMIKDWGKEE